MKVNHVYLINLLPLSLLAMSVTLLSCSGQDELQRQISELKTKSDDSLAALNSSEKKIKATHDELGQIRESCKTLNNTLTAHGNALVRLYASLQDMQQKVSGLTDRPQSQGRRR